MTPVCPCGKRGTPFRREWDLKEWAQKFTVVLTRKAWMEGCRCKKRGRWGLPFLPPMSAAPGDGAEGGARAPAVGRW